MVKAKKEVNAVAEKATVSTAKSAASHCSKNCCSCIKYKHRNHEGAEYNSLLSRLNRIEGQVRGVKSMVEEDRYCVDILTQVSAIQSALNAFNKELLAQHIKSCVVDDIQAGKTEVVDELVTTLQKLMK
jgi:DNA-binding FrmR family transcriptional regulator